MRHYSPLRYPGGKGRLAPFVRALFERNHLVDGHYVEPYAGGAAVARRRACAESGVDDRGLRRAGVAGGGAEQ